MTDHTPAYEPPALVEVGDFTDLTLGAGTTPRLDFPLPLQWT